MNRAGVTVKLLDGTTSKAFSRQIYVQCLKEK